MPFCDDTYKLRVGEAVSFLRQEAPDADVAELTGLSVAEVAELRRIGHLAFLRARGLNGSGLSLSDGIPMPAEVMRRRAEIDAANLAALRGRVPHGRSEREPRTVLALPRQVVGPNTV
jgi:hypothetical protein